MPLAVDGQDDDVNGFNTIRATYLRQIEDETFIYYCKLLRRASRLRERQLVTVPAKLDASAIHRGCQWCNSIQLKD